MKSSSNINYDFAWKPISKCQKTIQSEYTDLDMIYDIKYYYYQPFNHRNENILIIDPNNKASLGCSIRCMYNHPNSEYFECIGMGYKGLSGALITNSQNNNFLGLFVRRISYLGTSSFTNINNSNTNSNYTKIPRGYIIPTNVISKLIYNSKSTNI